MLCYADIADSRDRWRRTSMTSVGKVTATVWRVEKFLCTQPDSKRRPFAYETRMVPQDHCQCTLFTVTSVIIVAHSYQMSNWPPKMQFKSNTGLPPPLLRSWPLNQPDRWNLRFSNSRFPIGHLTADDRSTCGRDWNQTKKKKRFVAEKIKPVRLHKFR
jgi:hypothetical protein